MRKIRLTKKQVKAYEKASGLKTTGKVDVSISDDSVWKLMERLFK